jgi:hypothetical protein
MSDLKMKLRTYHIQIAINKQAWPLGHDQEPKPENTGGS